MFLFVGDTTEDSLGAVIRITNVWVAVSHPPTSFYTMSAFTGRSHVSRLGVSRLVQMRESVHAGANGR